MKHWQITLKYNKQYGYEIATEELLNEIRSNLYKVDSLDKPIKGLSAYKVSDLLNIANKLAIQIINKENGLLSKRTLSEFESYSGINFSDRVFDEDVIKKRIN